MSSLRKNNVGFHRQTPIISKSIGVSNQTRLKQIYEGQIKYINPIKKQDNHPTFHLPIPNRKFSQEKKNDRYNSYLESSLMDISTQQPNLRYSNLPATDRQRYSKQKIRNSKKNTVFKINTADLIQVQKQKHNESVHIFNSKKTPLQKRRAAIHSTNIKPEVSPFDHFDVGYQLYLNGKYDEAIKQFEIGLINNPNRPSNYYYKAMILLSQHKYCQGYNLLKKVMKEHPNYKQSTFLFAAVTKKNMINSQKKQKDKDKYEEYEGNEKSKDKYEGNNMSYLAKQVLDQAIVICTDGLEYFPNYLQLILYRGKLYEISKKYKQGHEDFQRALTINRNCLQALLGDYNCLKMLGSINNALNRLNEAYMIATQDIKKAYILQNRIQIFLDLNKLPEAKKDVERLFILKPNSSQSYLMKGLVLMKENIIKEGILSFERCISIQTNHKAMCRALIEIVKNKIQARDFYSALHHINRSDHLQLKDQQIQIYQLFTEGVIFLMKRKIKEGVGHFQKIMKQRQNLKGFFFIQKMFYLYRAFGYFMLNDHQKAIQDYNQSQKFAPKDKNTIYNQYLAEGIIQANKLSINAFQSFRKAQKILPGKIQPFIYRAVTHLQMAKSMDQLKGLEEIFVGIKQLDQAYDINENCSNLLYIRSLIYMYLGKIQEGLQDIVKAISKSQENVPKYFFFRSLAHCSLKNKKQSINDLNICINLDQNFALAYLQRAKLHFYNLNISKGLEDLAKYQSVRSKFEKQQNKLLVDSKVNIYGHKESHYHQFWLYMTLKMYEQAEESLNLMKQSVIKTKFKVYLYLKQSKIHQAKELMESETDRFICDIIIGNKLSKEKLNLPKTYQKLSKNNLEVKKRSQQQKIGLQYFTIVQYYHYLGVFHYNNGEIEQAINNFSLALKQKSISDLQQGINSSSYQQEEQEQQQDMSVYELNENQVNSINFNLFICYLKNSQIKLAYETFIRDILPTNQKYLKSQQIGEFSNALFQQMKQSFSSQINHNQNVNTFTLPLMITPYSTFANSLRIDLPSFSLITKLSLIVPQPINFLKFYNLKINTEFLLDCIKISQVQNRPEPPWVKRNEDGLIFTDQIRQIDIQFKTTMNDQQQNEDQEVEGEEEEEEDDDDDGQEQSEEEQEKQSQMDVKTFKDKMKLDDQMQRKLQRIMDKKH